MQRVRQIAGSVLAGVCVTLLAVAPARAQSAEEGTTTWRDKAFLDVNVGMRLTSNPFEEHLTPIIYSEPASIAASHVAGARWALVDFGAGVRVWKSVGVGATYAKFGFTEDVNVDAHVPNPVLFNQTRSATKVAPLNRNETALHFHVLWVRPVTPRIDIMLSAGPSMIKVMQDLVTGIELSEGAPPFVTVAIGNVLTVTREDRVFGLNFGIGGTYFMTPLVGVGGTLRYTTGSVSTELGDGGTADLSLGGFQVAFGARLRFR
jgi:hypothetical protein